MKKLYIKVDKQGYFLADKLITNLAQFQDEIGNIQSNYIDPIVHPIPPGIYLPKWNGSEWIEGKEIDLYEEKLKAIEKVKRVTKERIVNGIDFRGHSFLLREFPEQLNLNTTYNSLNLNQETINLKKRIPWKTKEGLVVLMSVTTFNMFYALASNHVLDLLASSKETQVKIKEAKSFEEVQSLIENFEEVENVSK